jgi:acetoin utilization protein AcuB
MRVDKIMSRNVVTIPVSAGLEEAAALMKEFDIRHLPVVNNDRLIGLITEGDLRGAIFPAMLEDLAVEDLMVGKPITVRPETTLEEAARLVYRNKIGCLPVIDGDRRLLGIVTVADMLAALIEVMGFLYASSRLDLILPERPEALEEACRIIQKQKGSIIGISLTELKKDQPVHLFRLRKTDLDPIVRELEESGYRVLSTLG